MYVVQAGVSAGVRKSAREGELVVGGKPFKGAAIVYFEAAQYPSRSIVYILKFFVNNYENQSYSHLCRAVSEYFLSCSSLFRIDEF